MPRLVKEKFPLSMCNNILTTGNDTISIKVDSLFLMLNLEDLFCGSLCFERGSLLNEGRGTRAINIEGYKSFRGGG